MPAPAGTFDIVLSSGWPGVMLHEAVGHGLEGDFNRKKTSAFAGLLGQQVAAKGVTVVDDGTIAERRGSLTIDDEGTPTNRTVLIEDGKLVGYMQDRQNARLMGMHATGNGRRESYAHQPMPRMTNTYMTAGDMAPEEIIASVKNGIYAVSFGGGQVDITSGKFVFGCTEAYMIENGKVTQPIKGAMLIGNGPDAMHRVTMIGNDMKLDTGIGMCGKEGQGVPVGVGQPHLRMNQMTVGGTQDLRTSPVLPAALAAGSGGGARDPPPGNRRPHRRRRFGNRVGLATFRDKESWSKDRTTARPRQPEGFAPATRAGCTAFHLPRGRGCSQPRREGSPNVPPAQVTLGNLRSRRNIARERPMPPQSTSTGKAVNGDSGRDLLLAPRRHRRTMAMNEAGSRRW